MLSSKKLRKTCTKPYPHWRGAQSMTESAQSPAGTPYTIHTIPYFASFGNPAFSEMQGRFIKCKIRLLTASLRIRSRFGGSFLFGKEKFSLESGRYAGKLSKSYRRIPNAPPLSRQCLGVVSDSRCPGRWRTPSRFDSTRCPERKDDYGVSAYNCHINSFMGSVKESSQMI